MYGGVTFREPTAGQRPCDDGVPADFDIRALFHGVTIDMFDPLARAS